jgi:protein-tyrosine phosphatase
MSAADTTLQIRGAPNFRELGGLVSRDGRKVGRGLIYRSGHLFELSAGEQTLIAATGLKLVCDLRSRKERETQPARWAPDHAPRELHLDVNADVRAHNEGLRHRLRDDPTPRGARQLMIAIYRSMPQACARSLALMFTELLSNQDSLPMLINCAAGKDRTGFVCALLLHALEVSQEQIVADYLLSLQRCDRARLDAQLLDLMRDRLGVELEIATIEALNGVDSAYLAAAWESLDRHYGGADAYLAATGLDDANRARLQLRLLEAG